MQLQYFQGASTFSNIKSLSHEAFLLTPMKFTILPYMLIM